MFLNLLIVLNFFNPQFSDLPIEKKDTLVYGIDISNHQGIIDWDKVKSWEGNPIQFIYIKATEGATFQDKSYAKNVTGAKANNYKIGSYHYFKTSSSPKDQFDNFKKTIDLRKQDLIPVVDVEEINRHFTNSFHKNLKEFLVLVEKHCGTKPIIYSFNAFYNKHLAHKYQEYRFIIGRYGAEEPRLTDKGNWHIWQFTDKASIEGISKKVDLNVLNTQIATAHLYLTQISSK
jgi:lysozyme